jgi:hypothetical protein
MFNVETSLEHEDNLGGEINININNANYNNNFPFHTFINYNKNRYLNKEKNQVNSSLSVRVVQPENNQIVDGEIKDLKSFLKFFLIKKIANKIENISNYENLIDVIKLIKNNQGFKEDINSKKDTNILDYLKHLDDINLDKGALLENLFKENQKLKNEIINYWKFLSKYEESNNNFQHKLFEDLKNCQLDYSIVNINIMERDNPEEYEQKKKECKNMKKMILYFLSEINPDFNILNIELNYSNKSIYGRGFYFSDSIDYIIRCQNDEKIPQIGDAFPLLVCEIFYDEEKLKEYDINLSLSESSQNKGLNNQQKIEPNGLKKIENFKLNNNDIKRIKSTEYVLSETYQIFPLYTFTLRRNEYYVLYRDPNLIGENCYSKDLKEIKLKSLKYSNNKNFYFISSTEEALKLLLKKKKVKAILITSIGRDESGKRFFELAKKILQCDDLIMLFFSNNTNCFNWITNSPNCLYTSEPKIYEEYISNYNLDGLKKLKEKIDNIYGITLCDIYHYYFDHVCDNNDDNNNKCEYFRSVYIISRKNLYLSMTKKGKVKKSKEKCLWEITIINNDITLFSNGFYLDLEKNKEIAVGSKEMKRLDFINNKDDIYYFYIKNEEGKKIFLSMEDDENILVKKKDFDENSYFKLKDI